MWGVLLEGMGMGLVLSMIVGPVFFALVHNSLQNGFRLSAFMALGILLSDALYVLISYFGVSIFSLYPLLKVILGYSGGLIMIGFGLISFFRKVPLPEAGFSSFHSPVPRKWNSYIKGFSLNGVNPFVLLFWMSIAEFVQVKKRYISTDVWMFYISMLLTVFAMDLTKIYIAKRLRQLITPSFMLLANRFVGLVLVAFGLRLLWFAANSTW
ncbi:lysine transporter LysE [Echinicola pacifica]|uniref:Lysine transporter LysE n=1 Tax=Echinicola pacifica TaxID=346377 RepID=A0A918UR30_9BACT|nr:LysE family translocator [Echinicola pacifica]GGZ27539.1 lysine transporter LysE [Echinicola pacifica]